MGQRDLEELYQTLSSTDMTATLRSFFSSSKTTWHTIPERAPHFGGLWEAAVKAAKHHLKRVMGNQRFTYEELETVAVQIEACLNSRPLTSNYSHDPDGVQPLTAGHLLIGKPLVAYPELPVDLAIPLCKRWTMCQAVVQQFWKRWSQEVIHQMQFYNKWKTTRPNLAVGDLVLMKDASAFQTHWGMARVVAVYPGDDSLVRAVDVSVKKVVLPDDSVRRPLRPDQLKVKSSTLRRPVSKLALLIPASDERDLSWPGGCSGDQSPSPSSQTATLA